MTTLPAQPPARYSVDNLLFISLGLFAFTVLFSVTAVQISLFLAIIFLLVQRRREQPLSDTLPSLARHPLFIPWLVYLGVCLLTAVTAYYPAKGFSQLNSDFLKYVCLSALLLAVRQKHLPRLAAIYTGAAALSAVFGIAEVVSSAFNGSGSLDRAGVFMNAVRYGEAMTIAFLLAMSRLLLLSEDSSTKNRLLYMLAAGLTFTVIILSQTRGAYLGTAAGLLAIFIFAPAARKRLVFAVAVLLAAGALLAAANPVIKNRITTMIQVNRHDFSGNSASTGINVRLELWKLGYKMFRTHPVVGVGPDNVRRVFKKFHPEPFPEEGIYGTLNNLYVHQAAERGLLGLGALLFLFLALWRYALENFRRSRSPYALWALCALPAFYVVNITEISFQHVHTSFAIFMALAFGAAADKETA
jgi:O-antigen ligase